jgi:hypothetical protein
MEIWRGGVIENEYHLLRAYACAALIMPVGLNAVDLQINHGVPSIALGDIIIFFNSRHHSN